MCKSLMYILGIPLTLTIIVYLSVLTYHNLEKDRVYRECVKNIKYLGVTKEFAGVGNGGWNIWNEVPNCLEVLGQ